MTVTLTITAADGAQSTVVLPDPVVNQAAPAFGMVAQSTNVVTTSPYKPAVIRTIGGYAGTLESVKKSYNQSIGVSGAGTTFAASAVPVSIDRFEIHPGDVEPYTGGQRVEWDAGDQFRDPSIALITPGTEMWISYWFAVMTAPADRIVGLSDFNICGQFHQSPGPGSVPGNPMLGMLLGQSFEAPVGNAPAGGFGGSSAGVRCTPFLYFSTHNPLTANSQATEKDLLTAAQRIAAGLDNLKLNTVHYVVHHFKTDPTGATGFWQMYFNGQTLAKYTGAIGYASDVGSYWKFGIYQDAGGTQEQGTATIMWYGNMEVIPASQGNLLSRVASPLSAPTWTQLF